MAQRTAVQGSGGAEGPPALVIVGDRVFSSGLVSDRPGGLESETHRIFQLTLSMLRDAGISRDADIPHFDVEDTAAVLAWVRRNSIDLTVIGPEKPLTTGLSDRLVKEAPGKW